MPVPPPHTTVEGGGRQHEGGGGIGGKVAKPRGAWEARPRGLALRQRRVGALEDCRQTDASSAPTQAHGGSTERREITGSGPEEGGDILHR